MSVIIPPMKPIPEGATREDRVRMYDEHVAELRRLNPQHFNADGSLKPMWPIWLAFGTVVFTAIFIFMVTR